MTFFKTALLGLTSAFGLAACSDAGSPVADLPPQPPMWVVSDVDSEITLYGTIHILTPETQWQSDAMKARLNAAEEVWFEIMPGSDDAPELQQTIMQLVMDPSTSLSYQLSPKMIDKIKVIAASNGIPFENVDAMDPWFLSILFSLNALSQKGFDSASGVETKLEAMIGNKPVRALETAEQQIRILDGLPMEDQIAMLESTVDEMDEGVEKLQTLIAAWAKGDVKGMEDEMIDEAMEETPGMYKAVFVDRNTDWVDQIAKEMEGSGTDFIAVGAGHLIGPDSVPNMLKAKGYKVKRVG